MLDKNVVEVETGGGSAIIVPNIPDTAVEVPVTVVSMTPIEQTIVETIDDVAFTKVKQDTPNTIFLFAKPTKAAIDAGKATVDVYVPGIRFGMHADAGTFLRYANADDAAKSIKDWIPNGVAVIEFNGAFKTQRLVFQHLLTKADLVKAIYGGYQFIYNRANGKRVDSDAQTKVGLVGDVNVLTASDVGKPEKAKNDVVIDRIRFNNNNKFATAPLVTLFVE